MNIAIIGSNGLLGSAMRSYIHDLNVNTLLLTHKNFEITNKENYTIFKKNNIDVIINTAAYLGVEPCESNPMQAFEINTKAVGDLARYCREEDITLVQISTDGVFDGLSGDYTEDSNPMPINLYGITKYNAEQLVKNLCNKYYIFRIPILFGKRENNGSIFIEKMHQLYLNGNKNLKIADDAINRPSYSIDISKKIVDIILEKNNYGIYHIFNGGEKASLYDFAVEFFKAMKITDINISQAKTNDFAKNELGIKPLNTTLSTIKISPLRNWQTALHEFCTHINS